MSWTDEPHKKLAQEQNEDVVKRLRKKLSPRCTCGAWDQLAMDRVSHHRQYLADGLGVLPGKFQAEVLIYDRAKEDLNSPKKYPLKCKLSCDSSSS